MQTFSVRILNPSLKWLLAQAQNTVTENLYLPECYSMDTLFRGYPAYKRLLSKLISERGYDNSVTVLRLFVQDFLLDKDVCKSFEFEALHKLGVLSTSHWQDMQSWSAKRDVDELEDIVESKFDDQDAQWDRPRTFDELADDEKLWNASKEGRIDDVRLYLSQRSRLVDAECLTTALQCGHSDIFWLLFYFGAAINGDPRRWMAGPIYAAARHGHLDALKSMVRQSKPKDPPWCISRLPGLCLEPLKGAVKGGHKGIVRYFMSLGVDITGGRSVSVMVCAARAGRLDMIKWLERRNAKLQKPLLLAAVQRSHLPVTKYLLQRGIKPDNERYSELNYAIHNDDMEMFHLLLEHTRFPHNHWRYCKSDPILSAIKLDRIEMVAPMLQRHGPLSLNYQWCLSTSAKSLEIRKIISGTGTYDPVVTLRALPSPWPVDFSDKCPLAQGIKARERARERLTMRQRLREAFYKSHDDFRSKCNSVGASYDLSRFGNAMSTARKVWKTGFQSLRRLLNNQLPPSVQEVFGCIQVSLAMRSTLDDLGEAKKPEAQNEFWVRPGPVEQWYS
jgi:ankyrin repeat protein